MSDHDEAAAVAGASSIPDEMLPDDERMTAAEFRVVREYLGLTTRWLADRLGVQERTVQRWEAGASPIPDGVRLAIEQLEADTAQYVDQAVQALLDLPDPGLLTYRSDADYHQHHPEQPWPASWHRATVARVAERVPALVIDYWQPSSASQSALSRAVP